VSHALVRLAEARRLLAEAKTLDEIKDIRNTAQTLANHFKIAKLGLEAQNDAAEIKVRAERKMGALLAEMDGLGTHGGDRRSSTSAVLETVGITRNQSSRWQKVAWLADERFEELLAGQREAEAEITTAYFLRAWRREKKNQNGKRGPTGRYGDFSEIVASGEHYGTVYADPPWFYGNQATRGATGDHYPGMTVDEIAAMPVVEVVEDAAHLHLWTTNAFLFDARSVLEAWGFEYKSCFLWVKPQIGMGNYWRVSHEFLLLGVRRGLRFRERDERSWQEWKRGRHSAKPEAMYRIIERVSPPSYLEMFARRQREGWTSYGHEVEQDLFFP